MARFEPDHPLLPDIIALHARWQPSKPALIVDGETLGWADFDAATNRVANGLAGLGLGPGDMVAVAMRNGRAMVEVLFGIMKAGACSVPLNLSITDQAMAVMIRDCTAKALFATDDQAPRIEAIAGDLPDALLERPYLAGTPRDGWADFGPWTAAQSDKPCTVPLVADGPCNVIYSSGTTGMPKGIVHTHRGRLDWAYDCAVAFRYHGDARTLCTIGLYSNIMWVAMLCTLLAGGTLVVHDKFDAARAIADIAGLSITHTAMVPVQYQRILEAGATKADLASLQSAITVGSKMHAALKGRVLELIPNALFELYGLTEGIITIQPPADARQRPDSVGRPIVGCDIKLVGDDDREAAPGTAGEIVSRARYVMPGYLNRPQATAEAQWTDDAGRCWLRTGDIGTLDADMNLYIVDRKKDMILSGGQNIYPTDIEAVLLSHPQVGDAAVIGVESARWGETPLAVVVLKPEAVQEGAAIMDWLNARVGRQQRVAGVELVDELPRNPNGKVLKRELRARYGGGARRRF